MSGHGEQPQKEGEQAAQERAESVKIGQTVYDPEGNAVGAVRGVNEGGFFVSTRDGVEKLSIQHARSGHNFGEAEIMWRCAECGEMGKISGGLPDTCPDCAAPKEGLMYWKED